MSKTTFVKIDTSSGRDYFLQTTLKDEGKEGFQLMVTDGRKVWSGDLTEDNIDSLCGKVKMDYNTYVAQTVKAFTQENMSGMQFEFQLKPSGGTVDFVWKKHVPADEIKFQLGSVKLYEKDETAPSISQMFQQCITNTSALQERIRSLNTDNERLSQERGKALKRLDKCVTAKEEVERDLYEKFVAVLNSKKEKIRALKRQVEEGVPSSVTDGAVPRTSGIGGNTVSDESDDEDVKNGVASSSRVSDDRLGEEENTDDETPAPSKRRRRGQTKQTVKREADTSLVLDDDDNEPKTVARRPARQRAGNKKQTPSKPVLPKVSSKGSDKGSGGDGRRSSMRKSSSHSSNKSSDYQDPDDLMADLE